MISGTEDNHAIIRDEICRYMVTSGKPIINRYLKTFNKTMSGPAEAVIKWSGHGLTGLASDVIAVRLLA